MPLTDGQLMLRRIEAKEVGAVWEQVRVGLVAVKKATTDDWLPEDVYMALKQGHATLYMGENEGAYLGFLVLRLVPTFHGARLDIWCAYSATKVPLMRRFFPEIQKVARQAGAQAIGFSSAREEWQAAAKRLGFVTRQINYEFTL